jgi:hypothetical protein
LWNIKLKPFTVIYIYLKVGPTNHVTIDLLIPEVTGSTPCKKNEGKTNTDPAL